MDCGEGMAGAFQSHCLNSVKVLQPSSTNSTDFKLNWLPSNACLGTSLPAAFKVGQCVIIKHDNNSFPGEINCGTRWPSQIKCYGAPGNEWWKWPAIGNSIFYFVNDIKISNHPEMENCRLRLFFKFADKDY